MLEFLDRRAILPVCPSASLPVKIVVSRQYLVFSKENAEKLVKNGFPFSW